MIYEWTKWRSFPKMSDMWTRAVNSAAVCELVWTDPDGATDAIVATPLLHADQPAVAFTYAHALRARAVAAAKSVAVVLSDGRMSGRAWRPLAIIGRPRLIEDVDGSLFTDELLTQELRKHPPSRALADSILLRREHWWFLPRIVVTIEPDAVVDVAPREPGDAVLGIVEPERLRIASVRVTSGSRIAPIDGALPGQDGVEHPALLIRHDFSVPDLERWPVTVARGVLSGDEFRSPEPLPDVVLPRPLGLLARIRKQHALARACRKQLAREGHA